VCNHVKTSCVSSTSNCHHTVKITFHQAVSTTPFQAGAEVDNTCIVWIQQVQQKVFHIQNKNFPTYKESAFQILKTLSTQTVKELDIMCAGTVLNLPHIQAGVPIHVSSLWHSIQLPSIPGGYLLNNQYMRWLVENYCLIWLRKIKNSKAEKC
jgi:hypothetical protein